MVGHKEPDQTKGLGYVLANSAAAMKILLNLIHLKHKDIQNLMSLTWVVDCEQILMQKNRMSARTDIVIRFYDNLNIKKTIIIEAKSINSHVNPIKVNQQLKTYISSFYPSLKNPHDVIPITLTNFTTFQNCSNNIYSITWMDLICKFEQFVINSRKTKSGENHLLGDFVNYMINL